MSNPFGGPQGPGQQPYGQQPPQQPYGQQPPQQPYGQPQQQPNFYAGPPPAQPQRKPWLKWLRIGVPVLIIAIAAIAYFVGKEDSDAEAAKVGDCMEHVKDGSNDNVKKADCGTPKGQYTVVGKFSGTTDQDKCGTVATWNQDEGVYFYMNDNGTKVLLCLNANADAPDPLME